MRSPTASNQDLWTARVNINGANASSTLLRVGEQSCRRGDLRLDPTGSACPRGQAGSLSPPGATHTCRSGTPPCPYVVTFGVCVRCAVPKRPSAATARRS
jgi:hypothetical protein